ncbi:heparinase II/III family protein, partial [Albidovulum sp.]|uniref:heparinase II/III family protein n=1 Tax=Albidovulum sp. TaxID=1872424 RepID=UPI0039B8C990
GLEGRLDQALAAAGGRALTAHGLAMGYARLAAGRTTVIVDAAAPPRGSASANAHASTLAMELTSGRRPVIVNCGSGASFGPDWRRAGRATPSHSTLCIQGFSSSRLGAGGVLPSTARGEFTDTPDQVWAQPEDDSAGHRLMAGHNGYVPTHGLTHIRQIMLSVDGRALAGEDTLGAMTVADRRRFETIMERTKHRGVPFSLRFHLHPDVDCALDLGGTAVSLALKSGEIWIFRHDGVGELTLEPSVYLESGRLKPRTTKQIVLAATVVDYACQLGWTLAKAQDTPSAIRDTIRDDAMPK